MLKYDAERIKCTTTQHSLMDLIHGATRASIAAPGEILRRKRNG